MDNGEASYRRFRDNGDERGLDEIIIAYKDGLMLYLTGIVGSIHTAEELTEDTFVLLGTKKPKYKGKSSFKTWLYAIGRNLAIDRLRKEKRHPRVSLDDLPEQAGETDAVEAAYFRKERQILLHRAMRKLKPEYQQVLELVYFENLSSREAAEVMQKSVRGLESVLYRAKKALRSQLESEGYDNETM